MIDKTFHSRTVTFSGAKGLVFIGDKILVFRRDEKTNNFPLHIDLPGGGREGDETPFETFAREAEEEFGIRIHTNDIAYAKQYPSVLDPTQISFFVVAYPHGLEEKDIRFGDEGLEYMLMTPEEFILAPDGVKPQQLRTKEYIAQKRTPLV